MADMSYVEWDITPVLCDDDDRLTYRVSNAYFVEYVWVSTRTSAMITLLLHI